MAVVPRGTSWQVAFSFKGQRIRRSFKCQEEAECWEREALNRLVKGLPLEAPADGNPDATAGTIFTLEQLMERTWTVVWSTMRSGTGYRANAEDCIEILGKTRNPNAVGQKQVNDLLTELRNRGLGGSTINRKFTAMRAMFELGHSEGYVKTVPAFPIQEEGRNRLRWFSTDEEAKIVCMLNHQGLTSLAELVGFLCDTGLRTGEAMNLKWLDVDGGLTHVWGDTATKKHERTVPQTSRVKETLTKRHSRCPANEQRVWWDLDQTYLNHQWVKLRSWMQLEGDNEFVPHACRHTFCTRLAMQGVPIPIIQKLAGHKTITVTMRYSHCAAEGLHQAIQILDSQKQEGYDLSRLTDWHTATSGDKNVPAGGCDMTQEPGHLRIA